MRQEDKPMNRLIVFAHRGASAYAPENTLPSFQKALDMHSEGIELDVQLSADGYMVVIHDETIDRTSNGTGRVIDMTFEALRQFDYGKWFDEDFTGTPIPLLQEVLTLLKGWDGLLNIEIKNNEIPYPGIEEKLIGLLRQNDFTGRALISSFNHESIRKVRKLAPQIPAALLYDFTFPRVHYQQTPEYDAQNVHPYYLNVNPRMLSYCHAHDLKVIPYTVDKPAAIKRLIRMGVDGIITNSPNVAMEARRQVLEQS
jgi:glycerophosphoryl diester phosphodiesterase